MRDRELENRIRYRADWLREHEDRSEEASEYIENLAAIEEEESEFFANDKLAEAAFRVDDRQREEGDPRDYLPRFRSAVREVREGFDARPDRTARNLMMGNETQAAHALACIRARSYDAQLVPPAVQPDGAEVGRLGDIVAMGLSRTSARVDGEMRGLDTLALARRIWGS